MRSRGRQLDHADPARRGRQSEGAQAADGDPAAARGDGDRAGGREEEGSTVGSLEAVWFDEGKHRGREAVTG